MKNLIITLGLILLMTMGIIHDTDSLHAMKNRQELKILCSGIAEAACTVLEAGGSPGEAKKAAADILEGKSEPETVWEMDIQGNTVTVKVQNRQGNLQKTFLAVSYPTENN